jgi:DNA polymerase-3 subunit epsilon
MELRIFNIEPTGPSLPKNDIIQTAAVRASLGAASHTDSPFNFVNPGNGIPLYINSYTNVSDAHLRKAPSAAQALASVLRFVGTSMLLVRNDHHFDMPFIRAACQKTGLGTRTMDYTDPLNLSMRSGINSRSHCLDVVIEDLGPDANSHRRHDAQGDAGLLAESVMNRNLATPAADNHWHVVKIHDPRRSTGEKVLLALAGKSAFLPKDPAFHPDRYGLEWRWEKLSAGPSNP